MVAATTESGSVPSLSVTITGQEVSREGWWRSDCGTRVWMRGDGAKKGNDGGRRILWRPGGVAERKKRQGVLGFDAPWRGKWGKETGPWARVGGQLGRPAAAPSGRARAAPLPGDRGGRRGASDAGASG
jgi:hypothetical protein